MTDLLDAPAVVQAAALRAGEVSSVDLVEGYLRRIEKVDSSLGAYVTIDAEGALRSAREAQQRRQDGEEAPFLGVPLSVKDLSDTAGLRTTRGLAAYRDRVPDQDDRVVGRLRAAGFVVLGKTTTPALGLGCVSEPAGYPPARNPWDPTRTPGGSSGGAAAALAAGLCAVSHGSDGGGSLRIPAAWTGLVGYKPSRGRVSPAPNPSSLTSTQGPIARTVRDAAALLDVMAGPELGDAYWAAPPARPFLSEVGADPGRLRIAVSFGGREADAERTEAVHSAGRLLESLGHVVEQADPEPEWGHVIARLLPESGAPGLRALIDGLPTLDDLDPLVAGLASFTEGLTAERYAGFEAAFAVRVRKVTQFFASYDVLLSPTTAKSPPLIGEHRELPVDQLFAAWEDYVPFTTMWNWTGSPAVSLPAGVGLDGLPLSVQLAAAPAEDALLLRLAAQLEDALGSPRLCPPDYTWSTE